MAARRVSKSAVDWAKFGSLVPKNQTECFKAFKTKSDHFAASVHNLPESLPKIDFALYKSKVSDPAVVDALEKAYAGVTVPYPVDKANKKAEIDAQEKEAMALLETETGRAKQVMEDCKLLIQKIEELPHVEEMTLEMYRAYFPPTPGSDSQPSMWPFDRKSQPGYDPLEIKSNFLLPKRLWERNIGEDKRYLW